MRRILAAVLAVMTLGVAGCTSDSDVVNKNLSKDADNFRVLRRVVFYNGITNTYILSIEGYCSVDAGDGRRMSVTCRTAEGYKRHFLGSSDNVTWFAEQLTANNVSAAHYKVVFKPSVIIPQPEHR